MKFLCLTLLIIILAGCARHAGDEPQLFEPGIISTDAVEYGATLSPDGLELYFVRSEGTWGAGSLKSTIYHSTREEGRWSEPVVAPFSGQYDDSDPHLTHDEKTLYFISQRPSADSTNSGDIWQVTRQEDGEWSKPLRLPAPINSSGQEYSPFTTANGDLYFASDRPGGFGQGDLYVSRRQNGILTPPLNLGSTVNSSEGEWNLGLNKNGDILLFEASGREQNQSSYGDLYISFLDSGAWTIPQNLTELNTTGSDLYPSLSDDGRTLFYASSDSLKSGSTNLYTLEFGPILKEYRQRALRPRQGLLVVNRSSHNLVWADTETGTILKEIPVGTGPHEVALSGDRKWAFVANYGAYPKPHEQAITSKELEWIDEPQNTVTRINLADFSTQTFMIPGTYSHHGILADRTGSRVWVTAENDGHITEIDGTTGEIKRVYPTMPGSHIIRGKADYSRLFVANIESNTVSVIDLPAGSVSHIQTPKGPEGMELSPDERQLWVLCHGAVKLPLSIPRRWPSTPFWM